MVIGPKNTGKSTLCTFLQSNSQDVVLLDCDIGKNASIDGCVSLMFGLQTKRIWIGELTPVNNLQTYLRAIRYLYAYYREVWFGKRLVVNTMGYTTGLGEFLLYEIYQIIKPKVVLVLKPSQMSPYDPIKKIMANL
jgi:polynucleotide 5'-kinase involved in rRNA processing